MPIGGERHFRKSQLCERRLIDMGQRGAALTSVLSGSGGGSVIKNACGGASGGHSSKATG